MQHKSTHPYTKSSGMINVPAGREWQVKAEATGISKRVLASREKSTKAATTAVKKPPGGIQNVW